MACEREAVLKLLIKLRRDLSMRLSDCRKCRDKALEAIEAYKAELEELLAEEPTYSSN